jgi:hypothetical protein
VVLEGVEADSAEAEPAGVGSSKRC